ncbi:MAG: hypothetical protein E7272_09130 [Pseudobutyrivibrio ruminis]|uniref:Uncharacterized protein n=1 Tax=Pseudobutyrivibrio ruminis TaxID=46206 RepID=A0A927UDQ2_9FIRM|nr:hypothetical protein [Pseudobutyrivibrio sp.]MBE5919992.1 hypothetical protein [Pseudobutyrivibrio ruminis]MBQ6461882.1 hypothetical protein [Pseudobutyrivibrio sp.]
MDIKSKELKLDELAKVGGGVNQSNSQEIVADHYCTTCKKTTKFVVYSGARGRCKVCGTMQYDL